MRALGPVRANCTGTGTSRRKLVSPPGLMGASRFDHDTTTWTSKLPCAVLPLRWLAAQVTRVTPSGNGAPDAGVHDTWGVGFAVSLALSAKVAGVPCVAVAGIEA